MQGAFKHAWAAWARASKCMQRPGQVALLTGERLTDCMGKASQSCMHCWPCKISLLRLPVGRLHFSCPQHLLTVHPQSQDGGAAADCGAHARQGQ